jgi:hypothetical protein
MEYFSTICSELYYIPPKHHKQKQTISSTSVYDSLPRPRLHYRLRLFLLYGSRIILLSAHVISVQGHFVSGMRNTIDFLIDKIRTVCFGTMECIRRLLYIYVCYARVLFGLHGDTTEGWWMIPAYCEWERKEGGFDQLDSVILMLVTEQAVLFLIIPSCPLSHVSSKHYGV